MPANVVHFGEHETIPQSCSRVTPKSTMTPGFGLLTPYTGENLGDGAIHDAVIWNIRRRFPDAVIFGITLNPADTVKRHGIDALPIAGVRLPEYHLKLDRVVSNTEEGPSPGRASRLWNLLGKVLAWGPRHVSRVLLPRGWPGAIRSDLVHIVSSYKKMKHIDILIVSGGGQLVDVWGGPWGHPYAMLKWTVLARLRGAKPIFLSVGYTALDARLSRLFTRMALSLASYRSYRDSGSRDLMRKAGFRRDDPVYPDLAYSYPLSDLRACRRQEGLHRAIGLSPFCYRDPRFWPRKASDSSAYQTYLGKLASIVRWIVAQNYRVSMFASDGPDRFAIEDLWNLLSNELSPEELQLIVRNSVTTVKGFLEQASCVDVMIASRLHSVLLAQLAGTPAIALSYDRKVDVQMEEVGHCSFRLHVDTVQLAQFQECFERMQANLDHARGELQTHFAFCRAKLELQYDAILGPDSRS